MSQSIRGRRPFTLLEVLLCIAIIALVTSLTSFKIRDVVRHYQVEKEVSELREEIRLTKYLAMAYQTEIELTLSSTKQGITLSRKTDEPMPLARRHIAKAKLFSHLTSPELSEGNSISTCYSSKDLEQKRPTLLLTQENRVRL